MKDRKGSCWTSRQCSISLDVDVIKTSFLFSYCDLDLWLWNCRVTHHLSKGNSNGWWLLGLPQQFQLKPSEILSPIVCSSHRLRSSQASMWSTCNNCGISTVGVESGKTLCKQSCKNTCLILAMNDPQIEPLFNYDSEPPEFMDFIISSSLKLRMCSPVNYYFTKPSGFTPFR